MKYIPIALLIITILAFGVMSMDIISTMSFGILAIITFVAFFLWFVSYVFLYLEQKDLETELAVVNDWRVCKGYDKKTLELFDI